MTCAKLNQSLTIISRPLKKFEKNKIFNNNCFHIEKNELLIMLIFENNCVVYNGGNKNPIVFLDF